MGRKRGKKARIFCAFSLRASTGPLQPYDGTNQGGPSRPVCLISKRWRNADIFFRRWQRWHFALHADVSAKRWHSAPLIKMVDHHQRCRNSNDPNADMFYWSEIEEYDQTWKFWTGPYAASFEYWSCIAMKHQYSHLENAAMARQRPFARCRRCSDVVYAAAAPNATNFHVWWWVGCYTMQKIFHELPKKWFR